MGSAREGDDRVHSDWLARRQQKDDAEVEVRRSFIEKVADWFESDKDLWTASLRGAIRHAEMTDWDLPNMTENPKNAALVGKIEQHKARTEALADLAAVLDLETSAFLHGYSFTIKPDDRLRRACELRHRVWVKIRALTSLAKWHVKHDPLRKAWKDRCMTSIVRKRRKAAK